MTFNDRLRDQRVMKGTFGIVLCRTGDCSHCEVIADHREDLQPDLVLIGLYPAVPLRLKIALFAKANLIANIALRNCRFPSRDLIHLDPRMIFSSGRFISAHSQASPGASKKLTLRLTL